MRWLAANISLLFTELPFMDRLAAARDHGFTAVECLFPYDHDPEVLARRAEAASVRFVLINSAPGKWEAGERGTACLPGREREFAESIDHAALYATTLGVDQVHVMAGSRNPGARERYVKSLRLACDRLALHDITVLIEPINPIDMPGYLLADFDHAAEIVAQTDRTNLGLLFDLYHCQRIHGAVPLHLKRLYPLVRHIQIAGTPLRHEPDRGDLPTTAVFEFLAKVGYARWIGCEYRPEKTTEEGLAWTANYPQLCA